MYTNIADNELTQYHKKILVNTHYTLPEVVTNTEGLFIVTQQGSTSVYKIIPLFNCEVIESTNPEDKVIEDNKGIICVYDSDTILYFKTNQSFNDFSIVTNTVQEWGKTIHYGVVYESSNRTPLDGAEVTITLIKNNAIVSTTILKTNTNGEYVHFITSSYDKINVTAKYANITHEWEDVQ